MGKEQHIHIYFHIFFVKRLAKLPPLASFPTTLAALALTAFLLFCFILILILWALGDWWPFVCPLHTKRVYLNSTHVCLSLRASKGWATCISNYFFGVMMVLMDVDIPSMKLLWFIMLCEFDGNTLEFLNL